MMTASLTDGFKGKKKTSQFHTHNTALPSLSVSFAHTHLSDFSLSLSLSLTGSPTHNCVFSQRGEKECEPQASDMCAVFPRTNQ